MSRYVKMESTSGGKMMMMKMKKKKSSSRSMDFSHVQIIFPHTNNNSQESNNDGHVDDDQIIKKNMIFRKEEAGKFSSNSATGSSQMLRFQKNASRKAKPEFSLRRHSTSERYCRVHDQYDQVHLSSPALEEDVQVEEEDEEEEEESWRRKKTNKTSHGKFLNVCKRFLRF